MISARSLTVWPGAAVTPVLNGVDLHVGAGEWLLVAGPTGSGKSTLLRTLCGLTPHFTGGRVEGTLEVDGSPVLSARPGSRAEVIGYVGQDPLASFVADTVEDEIAWTLENLRVDAVTMRRRVEDTLELLGLVELRHRTLGTLSGGQQQRVAIGAVLAAGPQVVLLDEPTSALDPAAADDVLAALRRLVDEVGTTVVMAEHRLERVLHAVDSLAILGSGGTLRSGPVDELVDQLDPGPPLVELARCFGWRPVPLSVRAARARANDLDLSSQAEGPPRREAGEVVASVRGVGLSYGSTVALRDVDLDIAAGQVTVVMGRNGAGKSSLCGVLAGLARPRVGSVSVAGLSLDRASRTERVGRVALVPQDNRVLLDGPTVGHDLRAAEGRHGLAAGAAGAMLDALGGRVDRAADPRDLSEGEALLVALAVVLCAAPRMVVLDEPTRGLDYKAKQAFAAVLESLATGRAHGHHEGGESTGRAVVIVTHDVELAAVVADRVVLMAEGEVIDDGRPADVLTRSAGFGPQVARVVAPARLLTVDELAVATDPGRLL